MILFKIFLNNFPDGGIDRFSKVQSFSSSMSDINGQRQEESESSDEGKNFNYKNFSQKLCYQIIKNISIIDKVVTY